MSRESRVPHPRGPTGTFVLVRRWLIRHFGLGGAAVLGQLEFLDTFYDEPGQPLASRARLVADLEGIVGKHVVDRGLKDLHEARLIRRHEITTMGQRNWETRVEYSLDLAGLEQFLATPESERSGDSRFREPPELPVPDPKSGAAHIVEVDVNAAAAPRAPARGLAVAAAPPQTGKRRVKRTSGIVTWTAADICDAERLEQEHPQDLIQAAAAALLAVGKEPVPGLVTREIERQQRLRATEERGAAAEAERQMRLLANPCESDLGAVERGYNLLPEKLRAHVKQKLENKNAQA